MKLALMVAVAENGVIGRAGQLPWRLPADLRHFKAVTMGKPVLMGRRTWESIGRALPGRRNVVISRQPGFRAEGAEVYPDVDSALAAVAAEPEVTVIGGAEIYRQLLPRAEVLHLTRVHAQVDGDTYFPELDAGWRRVEQQARAADDQHPYALTFERWERVT